MRQLFCTVHQFLHWRLRLATMAMRSKACVCGHLLTGIVGLNPACECYLLSGRGLCDGLITCPEESYWLWCVNVCDLETSRTRRPWHMLVHSTTGEKNDSLLVGCDAVMSGRFFFWHFEGTDGLHLQGLAVQEEQPWKKRIKTQHQIPEDFNVGQYYYDNLSCMSHSCSLVDWRLHWGSQLKQRLVSRK